MLSDIKVIIKIHDIQSLRLNSLFTRFHNLPIDKFAIINISEKNIHIKKLSFHYTFESVPSL